MRRVLPGEIESEGRVDDAAAHQLRPEQVDGRARELWIARQHAGVRLALALSRRGAIPLTGEQERRLECRLETGQARDALGAQVVALLRILHSEFGNASVHRANVGLAEKGSLPPQVDALLACQPQVDLFQMPLAVMAGDAFRIDAEEQPRGPYGEFVASVLVVHLGIAIPAHHAMAGHEVGRAIGPGGNGARGDQVAHEFVVRHIELERLVDVIVKAVDPFAQLFVVAEHVGEERGPAVEERSHAGGTPADSHGRQRGEQRVDQLLPLIGTAVGREAANDFGAWQAAAQVESDAPQKLGVGSQFRMRDALLLELPEDVVVDQVLARDRRFRQQRCTE